MSSPTLLLVILGSIVCAVSGQVSFKTAATRAGDRRISLGHLLRPALLPLLVGFCLYGLSMLLWLFALSRVELSYAFPFVSLSYVGIILAARLRLGEQLYGSRILGAAIIVLGVLLVSFSA